MKILVAIVLIGLLSCSSSKEVQQDISENINSVYYQKWVAGIQGGGRGINFYVNLKTPLSEGNTLDKVQFETYEAIFEKESEVRYVARIKIQQDDLILDENPQKEYGNKAPEVKLKPNEANLYFTIKGKQRVKNLQNVKEKQMLAYPSTNKEKN